MAVAAGERTGDIAVFVNGNALTVLPTGQPLYNFVGPDAGNYSYNPQTSLITHENCATKGSLIFNVPLSYLNVGGSNVVAIRARDRGSVNYVDVKVSPVAPIQ